MSITVTLTEAQASRVFYAMQAEAAQLSAKITEERRKGELSVASGRRELLFEAARDECLAIARMVDENPPVAPRFHTADDVEQLEQVGRDELDRPIYRSAVTGKRVSLSA